MQVRLISMHHPGIAQNSKTENVSTNGVRALTTNPLRPQERLYITSPDGKIRTYAHVVYCQRLADRCFAVGLRFQGGARPTN